MSEIRLLLANILRTEAIGVNAVTWSYHGLVEPLAVKIDKKNDVVSNQTYLFTDRGASRISRCGNETKRVLRDGRAWAFTTPVR